MSEIKKGDLVMVVHSCCFENVGPNRVFVVDDIDYSDGESCNFCGKDVPSGPDAGCDGWYFNHSWLRKIDPPATGEYDGVAVRKTLKHKEPA